jgi:general secretion pathway protein G
MKSTGRRNAFTLIEVLIVVIIMALLAATIIPQFTSSTKDARKSALEFNLHTMRSQVELYKAHHNGTPPTLADFQNQMTKKTDMTGSLTAAEAERIYGPYIQGQVPKNPYNNSNTLVDKGGTEGVAPTAEITGGAGWIYDARDGAFYPNNAEYYSADW